MTTLCKKVESMDEEIQIIRKTASSQQHDSKNAEIRRSEVSKIPELEGSSTASSSSAKKKEEIKPRYTNINMNNLFSKPKAMDKQEDMKAMDQQGDIKNLQKQ
ncbi:uncharacterized protein, partial [Nicotiana tomentosiformis]|uniref:uncharacterized protein n=1 Tax=Nicotiana tomentosiformis TaxID=4098 RepID=UPI00388C5EF0